jgi:hypothetical protein
MVVLLAWHAMGIIDNGGFQYLFEGSFEVDPGIGKTAAVFTRIDSRPCAEAFEEVFRLFPDSKPPTDDFERLELYEAVSEDRRRAIDRKFWSGSRSIPTLLARYIRENHNAFAYLNEVSP